MELVEEGRCRFRIPQRAKMRVPGIVYASPELIPGLSGDRCLEQVVNVAALPGIVTASYAMPDPLRLGRTSSAHRRNAPKAVQVSGPSAAQAGMTAGAEQAASRDFGP